MKIIAAICAIFITTTPVFALSCVQTSPEDLFDHFADADQHYVLALGEFRRDIPVSAAEISRGQGQFTFHGVQLSSDAALDRPLDTTVIAHWAIRAPGAARIAGDDRTPPPYGQGDVLVFLAVHGTDFSYTDQLCLPNPIMHPTAALVHRFRACLGQGTCRSIP